VNDRYGHAAGDAVLVETAHRLESVAGRDDLLFRWGGEEFLLVARGRGREEGQVLATRLLAGIASQPFRVAGDDVTLTASIGWAPYPAMRAELAVTLEGALDLADHALYQAKSEGRNRAVMNA
jgi:diguanylate cyclase (GGDEF)-like protein